VFRSTSANRAGDGDGADATVDTGGDITEVGTELATNAGPGTVPAGRFFVFGVRGCRGFFGIGGVTFTEALPGSGFGFGLGLGVGFGSVGAVKPGTLVI